MTSNNPAGPESDAAVLCSYSETVRDLFLSLNPYHYPCSYKPVFYNNALLCLLDDEPAEDSTLNSQSAKWDKRHRATKYRQKKGDLDLSDLDTPCVGLKQTHQLHASRYYDKFPVWPEQFLVYDTNDGRTNSVGLH